MEAQFTRRDDGVIDVNLGSVWHGFAEALQGAVTTRAPRGSDGVNPSTYWIDRTLAALSTAADREVIASGNTTDLLLDGDDVVAHAQYDTFDDQRMSRDDFLDILTQWRTQATCG